MRNYPTSDRNRKPEQPPLTRGLSFLRSKNDWGRDNEASDSSYLSLRHGYAVPPPSSEGGIQGHCTNTRVDAHIRPFFIALRPPHPSPAVTPSPQGEGLLGLYE